MGGRWNSVARPLVYASESLALCLAECLVHVTGALPSDYPAFEPGIPDDAIERLETAVLGADWTAELGRTRAIGDEWLLAQRSLALAVASAAVPFSTNILINPLHPQASEVRLVQQQEFRFDPRLRPPR